MPFNHWMLPGTHDAGSFLPGKLYAQNMNTINWDSQESMTTSTKPFFYGTDLGHQVAVTQHLNITGQLGMGARYFDLRFTRGKLPGRENQLYMDHNGIGFERLTTTMQEYVAYAQSLPADTCEVVWLRVKITSDDLGPAAIDTDAIPSFQQLEATGSRGKIHQWIPAINFPPWTTLTDAQAIAAVTQLPGHNLTEIMTYGSLCTQAGQRFSGVVYLIVVARESKPTPTGRFINKLQGKAIIEEHVVVGPAATRRRLHYVLETQNARVTAEATAANAYYATPANPWPYNFNQFRRVYLTSTGGQGDSLPGILRPVEKLSNLNIFLNSYGIWKYFFPSAIRHIINDNSVGYFKVDERPAKDHSQMNSDDVYQRITGTTDQEVLKAITMNSFTVAGLHNWTRKRGLLDRSHAHIIMLDYCELSCPTAVYYSTLVMESRLNPR